jgi:hypothetical protein
MISQLWSSKRAHAGAAGAVGAHSAGSSRVSCLSWMFGDIAAGAAPAPPEGGVQGLGYLPSSIIVRAAAAAVRGLPQRATTGRYM